MELSFEKSGLDGPATEAAADQQHQNVGAGEGNRTLIVSLGSGSEALFDQGLARQVFERKWIRVSNDSR
jgi:hypothetical protein